MLVRLPLTTQLLEPRPRSRLPKAASRPFEQGELRGHVLPDDAFGNDDRHVVVVVGRLRQRIHRRRMSRFAELLQQFDVEHLIAGIPPLKSHAMYLAVCSESIASHGWG